MHLAALILTGAALAHPHLAVMILTGVGLGSLFLFGTTSVPNGAPTVVTAAGLISPSKQVGINAAGVLALTLAAPVQDGQEINIIDETGHAHTVTMVTSNTLNVNRNVLTFGGTAGSAVSLFSRNGHWYTGYLNGVTITS